MKPNIALLKKTITFNCESNFKILNKFMVVFTLSVFLHPFVDVDTSSL